MFLKLVRNAAPHAMIIEADTIKWGCDDGLKENEKFDYSDILFLDDPSEAHFYIVVNSLFGDKNAGKNIRAKEFYIMNNDGQTVEAHIDALTLTN